MCCGSGYTATLPDSDTRQHFRIRIRIKPSTLTDSDTHQHIRIWIRTNTSRLEHAKTFMSLDTLQYLQIQIRQHYQIRIRINSSGSVSKLCCEICIQFTLSACVNIRSAKFVLLLDKFSKIIFIEMRSIALLLQG
jgi:hypothetical protein